jgi:hypothetical protein
LARTTQSGSFARQAVSEGVVVTSKIADPLRLGDAAVHATTSRPPVASITSHIEANDIDRRADQRRDLRISRCKPRHGTLRPIETALNRRV